MARKTTDCSPAVSVIIPTYNRRDLLLRAVESALTQTLEEIEVIICDDGSTDGTAGLFDGAPDKRIRYQSLPHKGACAARNAGIELARGKYIAFLDSDDVWRREKLAAQRRQLEESGADIVCCAFLRHDAEGGDAVRYPEAGEAEGRIDYKRLLGGNIVSTQTVFGKAECMKKVRFDERFPRMQDWEYAIRLAKDFDMRYFGDVMVDMYIQSDSISRKPELGMKAIRLLYGKYRHEFEASMPNTLLMLNTIGSFAEQCGGHYAWDYWRAVSPRRSWQENHHLLKYGAIRAKEETRRRLNALRRGQP